MHKDQKEIINDAVITEKLNKSLVISYGNKLTKKEMKI